MYLNLLGRREKHAVLAYCVTVVVHSTMIILDNVDVGLYLDKGAIRPSSCSAYDRETPAR
jgi:hypothetical protein